MYPISRRKKNRIRPRSEWRSKWRGNFRGDKNLTGWYKLFIYLFSSSPLDRLLFCFLKNFFFSCFLCWLFFSLTGCTSITFGKRDQTCSTVKTHRTDNTFSRVSLDGFCFPLRCIRPITFIFIYFLCCCFLINFRSVFLFRLLFNRDNSLCLHIYLRQVLSSLFFRFRFFFHHHQRSRLFVNNFFSSLYFWKCVSITNWWALQATQICFSWREPKGKKVR